MVQSMTVNGDMVYEMVLEQRDTMRQETSISESGTMMNGLAMVFYFLGKQGTDTRDNSNEEHLMASDSIIRSMV